jgi:hypothetical protein
MLPIGNSSRIMTTFCDVFVCFALWQGFFLAVRAHTTIIEASRSSRAKLYAPSSVIGQQ